MTHEVFQTARIKAIGIRTNWYRNNRRRDRGRGNGAWGVSWSRSIASNRPLAQIPGSRTGSDQPIIQPSSGTESSEVGSSGARRRVIADFFSSFDWTTGPAVRDAGCDEGIDWTRTGDGARNGAFRLGDRKCHKRYVPLTKPHSRGSPTPAKQPCKGSTNIRGSRSFGKAVARAWVVGDQTAS